MTDYSDNMTGVLFRNQKKTEDKHPDYTGKCEIEGVKYSIGGWVRTAKSSGQKFFSFKFEKEEEVPPEPQEPRPWEDE